MLNTVIKEIKELFSNKRIWKIFFTVLIIIIIGTYYNNKNTGTEGSDLLRMGVINNDDSTYSELLLTYFNGSESFSSMISVETGGGEEIKESFEDGELDIYVEIPENFSDNMIHIEHIPINVMINIEDKTKAIVFRNILQSYEKYISAVEVNAVGLYDIMTLDGMDQNLIDEANTAISLELIFTALGKEAFFSFQKEEAFPAVNIIEYYMIAGLVMVLLYSGLYGGFGVLREIKQGTFFRISTTRTPLYQYLAAKILLLCAALAVFTILLACIIRKGPPDGDTLLFGISISLFSVTFSMILSAFFTTTQSFMLVGNLLVFYFTVIGGGIIPIMFLPQDIIRLSKMTPFYYMMEGMIRLNQGLSSAPNRISFLFLMISVINLAVMTVLFHRRRIVYEEA